VATSQIRVCGSSSGQVGKKGTIGCGVKLDLQPKALLLASDSASKASKMEVSLTGAYGLGEGKSIYVSYVKKQITANAEIDFDGRSDFVIGYSQTL
jgi:hypothetical protein